MDNVNKHNTITANVNGRTNFLLTLFLCYLLNVSGYSLFNYTEGYHTVIIIRRRIPKG